MCSLRKIDHVVKKGSDIHIYNFLTKENHYKGKLVELDMLGKCIFEKKVNRDVVMC